MKQPRRICIVAMWIGFNPFKVDDSWPGGVARSESDGAQPRNPGLRWNPVGIREWNFVTLSSRSYLQLRIRHRPKRGARDVGSVFLQHTASVAGRGFDP